MLCNLPHIFGVAGKVTQNECPIYNHVLKVEMEQSTMNYKCSNLSTFCYLSSLLGKFNLTHIYNAVFKKISLFMKRKILFLSFK